MIGALSDLMSVFAHWRTWVLMGNQDIYMRYRRSVLGPFWISITMAAWVLGIGLLYGQIFDHEIDEYLRHLGPGYLIWNLISAFVQDGCKSAIDAERHLRSVRIPLPVLAARMVYRNLLMFLHNLLAIWLVMMVLGVKLDARWLVESAPGVAVLAAIGFSTALIMGPLCLRYRDIEQVIASVMRMLFFLTPVIWMPTSGRVAQWIVQINPFYHLIEIYRAVYMGHPPAPMNWLVSLSILGGLTVLAWLALAASRRKVFLWI